MLIRKRNFLFFGCLAAWVLPLAVETWSGFSPDCSRALGQAPQRAAKPLSGPLPCPLQRGVNFGNMLEAPNEGEWGLFAKPDFFDKVKGAGFDHIRLPVSWTNHAQRTPPYQIDETYFKRVDWCLQQAERRDLKVLLNIHHYSELNADPQAESPRALALWAQIANRYRDRSSLLYFEILNEPHGRFTEQPELWNQFMQDALAVIRKTNPRRPVVVGPVGFSSAAALVTSNFLPPADPNLIVTIHHYEPFAFTHQGAEWVSPSPPIGTTWNPNQVGISQGWHNWSWGSNVNFSTTGLDLTFNQGWAALYLHSDSGFANGKKLHLSVDQGRNLRIVTFNAQQERAYPLMTDNGGGSYTIELDPTIGPITDIFIQNNTDQAVPTFRLTRLELENTQEQRESLLRTELEVLQQSLRLAAAWCLARGLPLYLGEFGAYSTADMESRRAWTAAVRTEAENLGMGWAYWELAAGFGILDPETLRWRDPLFKALLPSAKFPSK